jgi:hypothetical protein
MARNGVFTGGKHWVKGQPPANPNGAPKLSEEVKAIKVNSRETVAKLYWQCVNLTKVELSERIKQSCSVFEEGVLRAIIKDMEKGNITTLEKLMDRVIGKPKEFIDLSAHISTEKSVDVSKLTTQEIENLLSIMQKGAIKNINDPQNP